MLSAEFVGFPDLDLFDGASGVVGHLRRRACCDLGFLAFEPDVAASLDGLALEDDITFYGNLKAGPNFEGDGGE